MGTPSIASNETAVTAFARVFLTAFQRLAMDVSGWEWPQDRVKPLPTFDAGTAGCFFRNFLLALRVMLHTKSSYFCLRKWC